MWRRAGCCWRCSARGWSAATWTRKGSCASPSINGQNSLIVAVQVAHRAVDDGLAEPAAYDEGSLVLTLRGRLLADALVRDLVD